MRVIILGANGMLGSMMTTYGKTTANEVCALTRTDFNVLINPVEHLDQLLTEDCCIVNCIGAIPQKHYSETEFHVLNTDFPHILTNYCKKHRIPLFHISTNCVFSGATPNCVETDIPDAEDVYGASKAHGEPIEWAVVLRCSILGPERSSHTGLMDWFLTTSNTSVNGYTDSMWNGLTTLELSKYIYEQIDKKQFAHCLVHLYSENTLSKYELLTTLRRLYSKIIEIVPVQNGLKYYTLQSLITSPRKTIEEQLAELRETTLYV
jgi:dTDP-4-dehydrorhamnose reductase